ncbi:MAG: hypothetical protein HOO94_09115 [Novosphingobium sp.]|uniref:hypothetical protein n=1 Tax=Novosphingobium sp. TaxID=1874826 RepID=UPI0017CD9E5D|nr:hypothetical protein [Novosphingobium sp.]
MSSEYLLISACALLGLVIVAAAMLRGWQGWLTLKTRELEQYQRPEIEGGAGNGMARIEIADLKERIRKLEAIAAGVDL